MPKFYYKAQLIKQYKYYAFHKPYGVLSQFSEEREGDLTIGKYFNFPPDVYPCGRLDKDSEGLLLLTNDLIFKQKIMEPKNHVCKQYLYQLEGIIDSSSCQILESEVFISVNGKRYRTKAISADISNCPKTIQDRQPPVRYRKTIPDSWLMITIDEGKNRQVRKMLASVGYPVLRLIRWQIAELKLHFPVGSVIEIDPAQVLPH